MNDSDSSQFEVHDREVLAKARSIISKTESPRLWAQAVIDAVNKNEEWRGERCINLLAPEAPTSPMVRALLSLKLGRVRQRAILAESTAGLLARNTLMKSKHCV